MFSNTLFDVNNYDIAKYSEMYWHCFNQKINEDYIKWKYIYNPSGVVVAYNSVLDKDLAAFYGVIPEDFVVNDKNVKIYQSMDTMTHPNYQKKGLFVELAQKTISNIFDKNDNTFLFGFPGNKSLHGFIKKINWKLVHSFSYVFINKTTFRVKTFFRNKSNLEISIIENFYNKDIAQFLLTPNNYKNKITPKIDAEYLTWKVLKNPCKNYISIVIKDKESKVIGLVIYQIKEGNRCFIEWISIPDKKIQKQVLLEVCRFVFNRELVKFIYTWEPLNIEYYKALKLVGFIKNPFNKGLFSYKVPFIIYSKKDEINSIKIFNIANYDIQPITQD